MQEKIDGISMLRGCRGEDRGSELAFTAITLSKMKVLDSVLLFLSLVYSANGFIITKNAKCPS